MDVSIIIVNYRTRDLLGQCLASVSEQTRRLEYEVIVVDNASGDGSVEMVRSQFPMVKLVASTENLGFGRGNNAGAALASGKYCLFLNPDTILMNNAVKILFDFMELPEHEAVAACGAALFDENDEPSVSFGFFPTTATLSFYSIPGSRMFRSSREGRVSSLRIAPFLVDFVSGADLFVRKGIFERLGRFDENIFAYYEEADLAMRLQEAGYSSAIVPGARIRHLEGRSFKSSLTRKRLMFESSLYYLSKYKKNSLSFRGYCLLNELKFHLYRAVCTTDEKKAWSGMITSARRYRSGRFSEVRTPAGETP